MRKVDPTARYDKDLNLWVRHEETSYLLGVTDWTQAYVGDIWSIIFEFEIGAAITAGQLLVTLESDKSATELLAPISGIISEVNEQLISDPALINTDSCGDGWLLRLKEVDSKEYGALNDAAWYENAINAFFRKGD